MNNGFSGKLFASDFTITINDSVKGTTTITNVEHILRGYEQIVEKLTGVGAKITIKEI